MFEKIREKLDRPAVWGLAAGVLIIAGTASGNTLVYLTAFITMWQWGYRAASEVYERGIICADCGDELDQEETPTR